MKFLTIYSIFNIIIYENLLLLFVSGFNIEFTKLERLLLKERQSIDAINTLLETQEETIADIKQLVADFNVLNSVTVKVNGDDKKPDVQLGHPVDVYLAIRRLAIDWKDMYDLLDENQRLLKEVQTNLVGIDNSPNIFGGTVFLNSITDEEFKDGIHGMRDLVNIYGVDIKSMANGIVSYRDRYGINQRYTRPEAPVVQLNSFDCFAIGKQSYDNFEYSQAREWFEMAVHKRNSETSPEMLAETYEHLAYCEARTSNLSQALVYMHKSLAIEPHDNVDEIKELLTNMSIDGNNRSPINTEYLMAKNLCQGITSLNTNNKFSVQSLHCYYMNTARIPVLRLIRVKVELLYHLPQIVVIHGFLSDTETQVLKQLAKPKLFRTTVVHAETKQQVRDRHRVAEGGWLDDSENQVVDRISKRIAAITGMDVRQAEQYNAIKYGVGGYYAHHYDVFVPQNTPISAKIYGDQLNRVASWINYLDDVPAGGATVFPYLGVTVWPEKGAALLWHNLLKSGHVDLQTYHGGCPVLIGHKWIATKWIPELGQTFTKPCSHDINEYNKL